MNLTTAVQFLSATYPYLYSCFFLLYLPIERNWPLPLSSCLPTTPTFCNTLSYTILWREKWGETALRADKKWWLQGPVNIKSKRAVWAFCSRTTLTPLYPRLCYTYCIDEMMIFNCAACKYFVKGMCRQKQLYFNPIRHSLSWFVMYVHFMQHLFVIL